MRLRQVRPPLIFIRHAHLSDGMDYYKRVWEFDAFARRLYKVQNLSQFAVGLAKLGPRRDSYGNLISGSIDPVWPNVDMYFVDEVNVANGTARPDSAWDREGSQSRLCRGERSGWFIAGASDSQSLFWSEQRCFNREAAFSWLPPRQTVQSN